jgi:hypothetical protein
MNCNLLALATMCFWMASMLFLDTLEWTFMYCEWMTSMFLWIEICLSLMIYIVFIVIIYMYCLLLKI